MSVTFRIEGIEEEDGDELPCPACGCSMRDMRMVVGPRAHCDTCSGYGGPERMPVPQFELNVANANAATLLRFLQLDVEVCGGELEPEQLLQVLAVKEGRAIELADCGVLSTDQVARYWRMLRKIARKAMRYQRRVIWN